MLKKKKLASRHKTHSGVTLNSSWTPKKRHNTCKPYDIAARTISNETKTKQKNGSDRTKFCVSREHYLLFRNKIGFFKKEGLVLTTS